MGWINMFQHTTLTTFSPGPPKKTWPACQPNSVQVYFFEKDFCKGNKAQRVIVLPTETHFEVENLQFGVAVHDPTQPYDG